MSTKQDIAIKLTTDISFEALTYPKHTIETIRQAINNITNTAVEKDSVLRMLCIAGNDEYLLTSWCIDNGVEYNNSYRYIITDLLDEICKLVLTIGKYTYLVTLGSNKSVDDVLDKVTGILIANDVIDNDIHKEMIKELERIALKLLNMIDYTYSRYREAIEVCWKGTDGNPVTECIITPVEEGDVKRAIDNLKKVNVVIEYLDNIKQLATDKDTSVIEMILSNDKKHRELNSMLLYIISNEADNDTKNLRKLNNYAHRVNKLNTHVIHNIDYGEFLTLLMEYKDFSSNSREVYENIVNELMAFISKLTYRIYYQIDGIRVDLRIGNSGMDKELKYKEIKI